MGMNIVTTTTRRCLSETNIFGLKGANIDRYDEVLVRTFDKESNHAAEMSFYWPVHRDPAGEEYEKAHKTCVDNTVKAVVEYLAAKSKK